MRAENERSPLGCNRTGFNNLNNSTGKCSRMRNLEPRRLKSKGVPLNATPDEVAKAVDWCERTVNQTMRAVKAGGGAAAEDTLSAWIAYRLVRELAADVGVLR